MTKLETQLAKFIVMRIEMLGLVGLGGLFQRAKWLEEEEAKSNKGMIIYSTVGKENVCPKGQHAICIYHTISIGLVGWDWILLESMAAGLFGNFQVPSCWLLPLRVLRQNNPS